ncbi:MAG TPA: hypothetical protein VKG89_08960 [Solirubrobacterales bacterium]|nr:hypothetical protein [Solirubrobacterales bacterium]
MSSSAAPGAVLAAGIALLLAGCGGEEDTTTEADREQEQIEQVGNEWASLFAASGPTCELYVGQPMCEREICEHVGGETIENCTPPSPGFRASFEDATVEDVEIKGRQAAAKFSNGEAIKLREVLVSEVDGSPTCIGSGCPPSDHVQTGPYPAWRIVDYGGNAGREFFPVAGLRE